MTITTQTIAKGIPPKLHDPKPKGKQHTKKSNIKTTQGSRKRATRNSDDESVPEDKVSSSDNSKSACRAKKAGKWQHVQQSDSEEAEMVEDDDGKWAGKNIEEVDGVGNEQPSDEQEVSLYHLLQALLTHHTIE
jgi:hypothetical protein